MERVASSAEVASVEVARVAAFVKMASAEAALVERAVARAAARVAARVAAEVAARAAATAMHPGQTSQPEQNEPASMTLMRTVMRTCRT